MSAAPLPNLHSRQCFAGTQEEVPAVFRGGEATIWAREKNTQQETRILWATPVLTFLIIVGR